MKQLLNPGKYVVAVSGGVDSVVLLDMLSKQPDLELIVAHLDHGIRENSARDRLFVEQLAKKYALPFEYAEGKLGPKASEQTARQARYDFLESIREKYGADGVVTAHHQDDVLETVILNLIRGTGRKGLSSLKTSDTIQRPLLEFSKQEITDYAQKRNLQWQEDETNTDTTYLRNWIRHKVVPKLSEKQKKDLLSMQQQSRYLNDEIESLLDQFIATGDELNRHVVVMLPHALAKELIAHWLRRNGVADFDSILLEKIVVDAKTFIAGKKTAIKKNAYILYSKKDIILKKS